MDLNELLKGLLGELQKMSRSETVVGKPLKFGDANLVPLSRISVGFGTGTTDAGGSTGKRDGTFEIGGAAGGLTVEPRAFVVVASDGVPQLLAIGKGGAATLQRAVELPNAGKASPELSTSEPAKLAARK